MLDNHDHLKACEDLGFLEYRRLGAVAQICERRKKSSMIPSSPLPNYPKLLFGGRECPGAGSEESKR
jgi:hypothetical protein